MFPTDFIVVTGCDGDESDDNMSGISFSYLSDSNLGVEVGCADFGKFDIDVEGFEYSILSTSLVPLEPSKISSSSISLATKYLAGVGAMDLNERSSLEGRLGYYEVDVDLKNRFNRSNTINN